MGSPLVSSTRSSTDTASESRGNISKSAVQTPFVHSADKDSGEDETRGVDAQGVLKRKLAFEEGSSTSLGENDQFKGDDNAVPEKPRSSRTTATKVSAALLQKIVSNQSGSDLKITGLIPFDPLSQLCDALANNDSTDRLDLEGCGIGDKGCILIRDLLLRNLRIKHVDLQMNQISDVGCKHLAEGISRNHTLQRLYLGYNDIRDDGVMALINSMRPRGQLEIVVNGNTHVSDDALGRLDRALEQQWTTHSPRKKEVAQCESPSPVLLPLLRRGQDLERKSREEPEQKCRDDSDRKCREEVDRKSRDEIESELSITLKRARVPVNDSGIQDDNKISRSEKNGSSRRSEVASLSATARSRPIVSRGSPKVAKESQKDCGSASKASDDSTDLDSETISDIYIGAPFSYKILASQTPSTYAAPEGESDRRAQERQRLSNEFYLQWSRFQQFVQEQLDRECRQLHAGSPDESFFEASCRFLSAKQFPSTKLNNSNRLSPLSMQSEFNRRRTVESRVKALLLKFRHIQEDTIREQGCQAHFLAAMQGTVVSQVPTGCSPEPTVVHVPCPFKLEVCVHGLDTETEYLI